MNNAKVETETRIYRELRKIMLNKLTEEEKSIEYIKSYINFIILNMLFLEDDLRDARMKEPFERIKSIQFILDDAVNQLTNNTGSFTVYKHLPSDFQAAKFKIDKVYLDLLEDRRKDYKPQAIGGRRKSKKNRKNKKIKKSRKVRRSS